MTNSTHEQVINQFYEIAIKSQILSEWHENHAARLPKYTKQEILALELIRMYSPITAKEIANVFGLAPSSAKELVRKFEAANILETCAKQQTDNREKPFKLTKTGEDLVLEIKQSGVMFFEYLLRGMDEKKLTNLSPLLEDISKSIAETVQYFIFHK
jgi:DNA-binding MarR family transcriptional regulator